jgi:cyclic pyranopterin phosphate synthase
MTLYDSYQRPIDYLRVSVTDRCNLRCVYCMPPEGVPWRDHSEVLTFEEIVQVVRVAAELGIRKVRLTGGEPLVRRGIVRLVAQLAAIPGIEDLSMTTNGTLLASMARDLAEAGLQRVNISLDSLDPQRFALLTRGGSLDDVRAGIEAATRAGLHPVKINTVVIRSWNDDEVVPFAEMARREGWHVRFIEFMPVGRSALWTPQSFVPAEEIRARIENALGPLLSEEAPRGAGPARYYRFSEGTGTIGLIPAVSEHFCSGCNRLRLSADGRLRPCLLCDQEIDLRSVLRNGGPPSAIRERLVQAIRNKPQGHGLAKGSFPHGRTMSEIGG